MTHQTCPLPPDFNDWLKHGDLPHSSSTGITFLDNSHNEVELIAAPLDLILPPLNEASEGAANDTYDNSTSTILLNTGKNHMSQQPSQSVGTWKMEGWSCQHWKFPIDVESYNFSFNALSTLDCPATIVSCQGLTTVQPPRQRIKKQSLLDCDCMLLQHEWTYAKDLHSYHLININSPCLVDNIQDPRVLEAHIASSKYNDDNPSYDMAME